MPTSTRSAPTFAEVDVIEERLLEKGKRTWRIAICRHRRRGDLVVLFANRDKVYGGSRKALYRGTDPIAARKAADERLAEAFERGYRDPKGARVCFFGFERLAAGRPARSLGEALRAPRLAAAA